MEKIVTRFPPSPTGHLHIGGARTALFNWLLARRQGGSFVLRIEDTDRERSSQEMTKAILEALEWLGLQWDQGPFYQSEREEIHLSHIQDLVDKGLAYYCSCTPEEVEEMRRQARAQGEKPKYNGCCREKGLGPGPGRVVRFKSPLQGETGFFDLLKGWVAVENQELDDFVLQRADGSPTYNLAVVVDDATMGITHILRGDDHLNNTPKQVLLYAALGYPLPKFGHVPMILGPDKKKLSKRHGASSVLEYREAGYLPVAVLNCLVRLGWSYGDQEIFTLEELQEKFSLDRLSNSACVFNPEKFQWVNGQHIKASPPDELANLLLQYLPRQRARNIDLGYLEKIVPLLQPRAVTMCEMAEQADFFVCNDDELVYDPKLLGKFFKEEAVSCLQELLPRLQRLSVFSRQTLEDELRSFLEEKQIKFKLLAQPLRIALSAKTATPGLFEVMEVLGQKRVVSRLQRCLSLLAG